MKVELKICERCGAIWLRPLNSGWLYCSACFPVIRAMCSRVRRSGSRPVRLPRFKKAGAQ
jgi:hypothetical protein